MRLAWLFCKTLILLAVALASLFPLWVMAQPTNNTWVQIGGAIDLDENQEAQDAALKISPDGLPIIAWSEAGQIHVKRWQQDGWEILGTALNHTAGDFAYTPALELDPSGNPYIAWQEFDGQSRNIYVKHWTGEGWESFGESLDLNPANDSTTPTLSLDDQAYPIVAWREQPSSMCVIYAKRWTGDSWQQLGESLNNHEAENACRPSLAITPAGDLYVAWYEWRGISNNIYVKQWLGNHWQMLAGPLDVSLDQGAYNPVLVVNKQAQVMVAWREYDGKRDVIYVKTWNGNDWQQLGSAIATTPTGFAQHPVIAYEPKTGHPVVAWEERNGRDYSIYASYWNGQSWQLLGNALDIEPSASAHKPSIAFSKEGQLYLAWEERSGNSRTLYLKKYAGDAW